MARPSKQDIELREKILNLNLFKRDDKIYTDFENECKDLKNKHLTPHLFCEECHSRDFFDNDDIEENFKGRRKFLNDVLQNRLVKNAENDELFAENLTISDLKEVAKKVDIINDATDKKTLIVKKYHFLIEFGKYFKYAIYNKIYYVNNEILHEDEFFEVLKKVLSKEKYKSIVEYQKRMGINFTNKNFGAIEYLTDKELTSIKEELEKLDYRVDITHIDTYFDNLCEICGGGEYKNKNVYIEFDLSKPLDELIELLKTIKNDFDKNPQSFKNLYELLGGELEPYTCDIKECDILTENKLKPLYGRLSDILFIYDCKKINKLYNKQIFNNEYIQDELNRYWTEVKNLYTDKIQIKTINKYYQIACKYIDDKNYKNFIIGTQ